MGLLCRGSNELIRITVELIIEPISNLGLASRSFPKQFLVSSSPNFINESCKG